MKQQFIELKSKLKANAEDLVAYFRDTQELSSLSLLMLSLSSLIICVGLNFNQSLIIYAGLLLNPYIFYIIQFIISIYTRDNSLSLDSFTKLVLGFILTFIIGLIYFKLTPFAYNLNSIQQLSKLNLPVLLSILIIGLTMDLFNRIRIPIVIWILKLIINGSVMIIAASLALIHGDYNWMIDLIFNFKLLVGLFFIGFMAMIWSFGISRKETTENKFKLIYPIVTILWVGFTVFYGINEFMRLTTQFNTEQYFETGFETNNFHIQNFKIEKQTKQIKVYYTGLKPAMTQDESLKKKYNLSGYHFEYIDLKQ